jgi:hypothetical protein
VTRPQARAGEAVTSGIAERSTASPPLSTRGRIADSTISERSPMNSVTSSVRVFPFGRRHPKLISVGTAGGAFRSRSRQGSPRALKGCSPLPIQK